MQRIGIFGGTFNPPHLGHIQAARQGLETLGLTKILFIPNRIAPHKALPPDSPSPADRLAMLKIAIGRESGMEASDLELTREGISYTVDTLAALETQYPEAKLTLLMGTDMFLNFSKWRESEKIVGMASLGVFYRGEKGEKAAIEEKCREITDLGGRVRLVKNAVVPISSTQMRRLLAFQCADAFLPEGVGDYIREKGLYHTAENWRNLPMDKLEQVVISLLNPNRVAHVLGCRDTAVELAKRWGADETDAARAGILHDITKALDGPLQLTLCDAYGKILNDFSRRYPKTLHALTGSLVAERIFGENKAVVDAIRSHTTGKADMNLLETIIYVADYMEPNRKFPGVERLRELAYRDITGALKLGLDMTMEHLRDQGSEASPESREALEYLKSYVPNC